MATHAEALRVMHALHLVYSNRRGQSDRPIGEAGDPKLIPNYCVAPGISGYAILWDNGPERWAERFPLLRNECLRDMDPVDPNYRRVDTEAYANVYTAPGLLLVR